MAVMASACVFERFDADDDIAVPAVPVKGKMAISLVVKQTGAAASRADLVDGNDNEQKIGSGGNFAILFDKNKKFHSVMLMTLDRSFENSDVIENRYTMNIDPDDLDTDPYLNLPKYCLVVLNGSRLLDKYSEYSPGSKTSDEILKDMWETDLPFSIGFDDKGLFTMTNSVYFDESGAVCTLAEIDRDMIFDRANPAHVTLFPKEGSTELYRAPVLTVYVERMVAKFTFEVGEGKQPREDGSYLYVPKAQQVVAFESFKDDDSPVYSARNWAVELIGWNVNGLQKRENIFKQIKNKKYFDGFEVNSPGEFRSYWAEDPDYTGRYPWQYRKSLDVLNVTNYEALEETGNNILRNYSFSDLSLDDHNFDLTKAVYVPENTYDYAALKDGLDGRTDYLAGTHLLLGARLLISNGNNTNYLTDQDLYRDRDGFFYLSQKACFKCLLYGFNSSLKSQNAMKFTYFNWDAKSTANQGDTYFALTEGTYSLYYDGKELTYDMVDKWPDDFLAYAEIRKGDGKRLPWPGKNGGFDPTLLSIRDSQGRSNLRIVIRKDNLDKDGKPTGFHTDTQVRSVANSNDVLSLMFEWVAAVDHFNKGLMYYTAPATIKSGNPDICGVVRNSWYSYTLKDINNVGTPVDLLDQEIIPDPINNKDQLNITVNILDWHVVDGYVPIL